jgi:replication factor C subunit 3/5
MPRDVRIELISHMANLEHNLASGTSERLQLGALCGAFAHAKEAIVAAAQ